MNCIFSMDPCNSGVDDGDDSPKLDAAVEIEATVNGIVVQDSGYILSDLFSNCWKNQCF